jgi:archaellin
LLSITAFSQQTPDIYGYVRNYTGVLFDQDTDYSIIQNTMSLTFEKKTPNMAFKLNPYVYQNAQRDDLDFGLREAYIDLFFNHIDLRIGKQQIVWGKADGVFITDVVSPKDLREFLLPDFDEIRIGITAIKLNYNFVSGSAFELVLVPEFEPTRYADKGSIWFPAMPLQGVSRIDLSEKEITPSLKNSEVFLKYSKLTEKIDYEIMGGYMYDDDQSMHFNRYMNPVTHKPDSIVVTPRHHRLGLFGGSLGTEIRGVVLRSEAAYYMDKRFMSTNPMTPDGLIEKDYVHYLVGVDWITRGVNLSVQFIQEAIIDYDPNIGKDKTVDTMTFLANDSYFNDKLTVQLFAYWGVTNEDALIRPSVIYELYNGLNLTAGSNIFLGSKGLFGQFDKNDMAYFKLKYDF